MSPENKEALIALTAYAVFVCITCTAAYFLGYYVGMTQPRAPTFSEHVYQQNQMWCAKHPSLYWCNSSQKDTK